MEPRPFPQYIQPAQPMWGSFGAHPEPQGQILDQIDQQLDHQLPLSADDMQPYDSGNLGFIPFDL